MTEVITAPGVETIEHLDWKPACQSPNCEAGHPAATYIAKWHFPCDCYNKTPLRCTSCVARILYDATHPSLQALGWRCKYCGCCVFLGEVTELVTVKPLP